MGDAVVFTGMRVREWRVGCVVAVLVVSGLWRTSTVHLTPPMTMVLRMRAVSVSTTTSWLPISSVVAT